MSLSERLVSCVGSDGASCGKGAGAGCGCVAGSADGGCPAGGPGCSIATDGACPSGCPGGTSSGRVCGGKLGVWMGGHEVRAAQSLSAILAVTRSLYIHVATHDMQSSLSSSPCPQWRGGGLSNVEVVVVFASADVGTERLTVGVGGNVRWPI